MSRGSEVRAPAALLATVHEEPGISRAEAARRLGMTSGFAAETTARLAGARLLTEAPGPPTGRRGRPTTTLLPHPDGPVMAVAAVAHETWRVAVVALGGEVLDPVEERHGREAEPVLTAVRTGWRRLQQRFGSRIQAWVVAVPGTVTGTTLVQAPNLGWRDLDLRTLRPRSSNAELLAGNDATLAGLAEHRWGASSGAGTAVHLFLDEGVGGALVADGRPVTGATGTAGEFGHLPLGPADRDCSCGARGCWNTTLDGEAVARLLDAPPPADPVSYTRAVLAAAAGGSRPELHAVRTLARSLGRGAAALANALDPEIVTVGGLGRDLLALAGDAADTAYRRGLMAFRTGDPPPVVAARFGAEAPVLGAAEDGWARVLTDEGLERWAAESRPGA
jgi:predicted NBD/HSP70 family sugar kinase